MFVNNETLILKKKIKVSQDKFREVKVTNE